MLLSSIMNYKAPDEAPINGEELADDQSPCTSPYWVLQHMSEEAFRVAGDAIYNVFDPTVPHQQEAKPGGHRRSQSEVLVQKNDGFHRRSGSFQRLKMHMQKAWKWGGSKRGEGYVPSFNPEVLVNQKRQWYQLHSKALDKEKFREPDSLFELFIIAGVHHNANLYSVEDAFAKRKKWELGMAKSDVGDQKGPSFPTLAPHVLFKYPPGKKVAVRLKDLAAFCFPAGVKTRIPERTPSLSDLNELVYGQEHMGRDDSGFVFSLRVGDSDTLYGVCLHVWEIVQKPPGLSSHNSHQSSRFIVSAPRCYCLLTRVPFFDLHFEVLNSIIAQERLNRITQFVSEMSLTCLPKPLMESRVTPNVESDSNDFNWEQYAIPVDKAATIAAAAAGILDEKGFISADSPESGSMSETSESSDSHSRSFNRILETIENGAVSPDVGSVTRENNLERVASFDALFSPVRSTVSEEDEDDLFPSYEVDVQDNLIFEWAKENNNDLIQIVSSYHATPLIKRGSVLAFQPLTHLQSIEYKRPSISDLQLKDCFPGLEAAELNSKLSAIEEAHALTIWTTATVCRVLSLESILSLLTGVLLEKQVVVVCSNLGVLSAIVLSVIPLIQPFQWQSLLLPILPSSMIEFLDAPVPYVVGIYEKPSDMKLRTSNLVHINVKKDQVKTCNLPTLPRYKDLVSELKPIHSKLSAQNPFAKTHPVYKCNEEQAEAANEFLAAIRRYLESLCSDLPSHTITNVQSNNDRVSLLLKDSFVDSFPSKDRPFVKLFVDTQQFALLSDFRLSTFESRRF